MKTFLIIWFGQLISQIGTALTRFALLLWVYQSNQRVLDVALLGFFAFLPALLVSPLAGVWVDRWDRRKVLIWADAGAGLMTAVLLTLHLTEQLQVWHLYAAQLVTGAFTCFQSPALTATTTLLVDKGRYARVNGLQALAHNGAEILAPFLASLLVMGVGLSGVLLIDLATFLAAVVTLLLVTVPRLQTSSAGSGASSLWQDLRAGLVYIQVRPGLISIIALFVAINFITGLTLHSTLPALILARSGGDQWALAMVQAAIGGAALLGSAAVALWGGPRRKIHGVLLGAAFSFLWADLAFAVGRTLPIWVIGAIGGAVVIPLIDSSNLAILQAKVAPAIQGRFFALFHTARQALIPPAILLGGLLSDRWLEPAMTPTGFLAPQLRWLVGTGPGAGIALLFVGAALAGATVCLAGYLFPVLRNIEADLADHDVAMPVAASGDLVVQGVGVTG